MSTIMQQPERHTFIARSIEITQRALSFAQVERALGDYYTSLSSIIGSLVIPEIRDDGRLQLSRAQRRTDAVPVVALRPGEIAVVRSTTASMTRTQRRTAAALAKTLGYSGPAPRMFAWSEDANLPYATERMGGLIYTQAAVCSGTVANVTYTAPGKKFKGPAAPERIGLTGRPLLILNYKDGAPYASPATILHEATHIKQVFERPLQPWPATAEGLLAVRQRAELEAAYIGASANEGQIATGGFVSLTNRDLDELFIKQIINKHNGHSGDLFNPSQPLLDELASKNLGLVMDANGVIV